jgi:hypothetical protein
MPFFGYSKQVANEHGLHDMREVTFDVSSADLRRIARFLNECADQADAGDWQSSHRHLTEFDLRWDDDHPNCDLIVIHPAPYPPKRVD